MSGLHRTALVFALWFAGLGAAGQFAKISVQIVEIGALYPESGGWLGFTVSLISAMGALLGLFTGILGNRIGARRMVLGGLALGAAISALQALGLPLWLLLATRVVEGLAHLGIVVAAPTLMSEAASDRWRPAAMTLWGTFFGTAFALVAWFGLPFAASHGALSLFAIHALWMALAAGALALLLPRRAPARPAEPGPALTPANILARHREAYARRGTFIPATIWIFYTLTYVALMTVLPTLVMSDDRAFVAGAMPLASILVSMTLGVVLLRFLPALRVTLLGFLVVAGLGLLIVVLGAPSPWLLVAMVSGFGLIQGSTYAAIPQLNTGPEDQALANGAVAQTGNIGNIAGTPILLGLAAWGGVDAALGAVIALHLAGAAFIAATTQRR